MATIDEADGEEPESLELKGVAGLPGLKREGQTLSSSSSQYSADSVEEARTFEGLSGAYQPSMSDLGEEIDRYMDINTSVRSLDSDAIPAPLSVQKTRKSETTATKAGNEFETPTKLASFKIPVIHANRISHDLRSAESNSFTPDKTNSWYFRMEEARNLQLQRANLGSHPLLRELHEPAVPQAKLAAGVAHRIRATPTSEHARVDSGIGLSIDEFIDEGYATATTKQLEFKRLQPTSTTAFEAVIHGNSQQPPEPTLSAKIDDDGQAVGNVDIQALRNEVGISALRLPSGPDSPKHPHHPFAWNHEKVMCRDIHNPKAMQPQLPESPQNQPLYLSRMDSEYFNSSTTKGQVPDAKMCGSCGKLCCRFANLLITSKIATSKDLAEEMVRLKAEQRVNMLRTYHPSGIEEYDTFLDCTQCGHHVCPACASKCTEYLCQAIVCIECTNGTQVCPVHNFS